jgi:hypothetical protein
MIKQVKTDEYVLRVIYESTNGKYSDDEWKNVMNELREIGFIKPDGDKYIVNVEVTP